MGGEKKTSRKAESLNLYLKQNILPKGTLYVIIYEFNEDCKPKGQKDVPFSSYSLTSYRRVPVSQEIGLV